MHLLPLLSFKRSRGIIMRASPTFVSLKWSVNNARAWLGQLPTTVETKIMHATLGFILSQLFPYLICAPLGARRGASFISVQCHLFHETHSFRTGDEFRTRCNGLESHKVCTRVILFATRSRSALKVRRRRNAPCQVWPSQCTCWRSILLFVNQFPSQSLRSLPAIININSGDLLYTCLKNALSNHLQLALHAECTCYCCKQLPFTNKHTAFYLYKIMHAWN